MRVLQQQLSKYIHNIELEELGLMGGDVVLENLGTTCRFRDRQHQNECSTFARLHTTTTTRGYVTKFVCATRAGTQATVSIPRAMWCLIYDSVTTEYFRCGGHRDVHLSLKPGVLLYAASIINPYCCPSRFGVHLYLVPGHCFHII